MKIYDFDQYSEEWYQIRLGLPTSSQFSKLITTKGEPSKQRQKYLYQVAGEFVAGKAEETYQNAAMARGTELEAEARKFYEVINDVEVMQIGFCTNEGAGCSPDGLVGDKGLLEIKCPIISTHVGYLLKNTLTADYFQQVQGQMLVMGKEWTDLLSYYPGIKPLIIRVNRDEKFISALRVELKVFCQELQDIINKIK